MPRITFPRLALRMCWYLQPTSKDRCRQWPLRGGKELSTDLVSAQERNCRNVADFERASQMQLLALVNAAPV